MTNERVLKKQVLRNVIKQHSDTEKMILSADTAGTYLWGGSELRTIDEVQEYWTRNVNTTQFWTGDSQLIGSAEFFDKVSKFIKKNYAYRYQVVAEQSKIFPGGKLLEVGCGAGWEAVEWARSGMELYLMDISHAALELAKKNLDYNKLAANLQWGNAEDIPFGENTFDMVSSFGVLHHTECTEKAISEIWRVLKPGGEAVVTFYYKYSWKIILSQLGNVNFEFSHQDAPITRLFDKEELKKLFCKFNNIKIFQYYNNATRSPRTGKMVMLFNYVFVPLYNLLPEFFRKSFGHVVCVVVKK